MEFQCSGCGMCCRKVGAVVKDAKEQVRKQNGKVSNIVKALANFPYGYDETGTCEKLIDDKCSVYDKRPDVCSVERSFKLYSKGQTKEEYYSTNGKICNAMIREAGLPETFLVKENY